MILELSFLTGRFHATPWGRHVNEAVPEWPPSPFRLVRALLDAWYRKHPELARERVEGILEKLASPPVFALPPASASHTRSYLSQNGTDPSDKKLVFDGFAVLDGSEAHAASVLLGWPGVQFSSDELEAVTALCGSLNYLGRSESWVEARIVADRNVTWNCVPLRSGETPSEQEVVSVACIAGREAYLQQPFQLSGKKGAPRTLDWIEALGWGSAEAIENRLNRPPALESVFYLRRRDALSARPRETVRAKRVPIDTVRFAAESKVRIPVTEALVIGEEVRRNLAGAMKRVQGHGTLSQTFTGKDAEGNPVRGHPHASVLVLDDDGDGYIDTVIVSSPTPFSTAEQQAIDSLHPVRRRNGHPLVLTPVKYGSADQLRPSTTVVVSHTPFAPYLHWKKNRDGEFGAWLRDQVTRECLQRGLPEPIEVTFLRAPTATQRKDRWLDFRRGRRSKGDAPRPAFGLRLVFPAPVPAPFSLGYASHYGLGCFIRDG